MGIKKQMKNGMVWMFLRMFITIYEPLKNSITNTTINPYFENKFLNTPKYQPKISK